MSIRDSVTGTAERCLLTARLFGDESELAFWTVALHYIRAARSGAAAIPRSASAAATSKTNTAGDGGLFLPIATPVRETFDLLVFEEASSSEGCSEETAAWRALADRPLGACHDVVQDNRTFADYERRRAALHDARRAPGAEHNDAMMYSGTSSSADAEIAQHASHWMLPKYKNAHFSVPHWSSLVVFWITGYYDTGRLQRAGGQITVS